MWWLLHLGTLTLRSEVRVASGSFTTSEAAAPRGAFPHFLEHLRSTRIGKTYCKCELSIVIPCIGCLVQMKGLFLFVRGHGRMGQFFNLTGWLMCNFLLHVELSINYFTSSYPHHDIYTFCYCQIFWHSIWHLIWHSLWHTGILSGISSNILFGISSGILSDILSGILSGIPSGILSGISSNILSGISSGILSGRWGPAVHTELGRSQVEVQRCTLSWAGPRLRSSGAHWAGQLPLWVHTELGRSQVEVQRYTLSWEGPRLRSSGAHWAGQVPGWGPAVHTELGRSQVEVQRYTLSWEGPRLRSSSAHWRNWRRRKRRRRRRTRMRRKTTALIKSNNPHLAGGEL